MKAWIWTKRTSSDILWAAVQGIISSSNKPLVACTSQYHLQCFDQSGRGMIFERASWPQLTAYWSIKHVLWHFRFPAFTWASPLNTPSTSPVRSSSSSSRKHEGKMLLSSKAFSHRMHGQWLKQGCNCSDGVGKANKSGRHRRGRLSGLSHPAAVLGEESGSSSLSSSPTKPPHRSPFSTIQDPDEMLQMIKPPENLPQSCALPTGKPMLSHTQNVISVVTGSLVIFRNGVDMWETMNGWFWCAELQHKRCIFVVNSSQSNMLLPRVTVSGFLKPLQLLADSSMSGTTAFDMGEPRSQDDTSETTEVRCPPRGVGSGGTASQARPPLYPSPAAGISKSHHRDLPWLTM